jgi:hypothetical protein
METAKSAESLRRKIGDRHLSDNIKQSYALFSLLLCLTLLLYYGGQRFNYALKCTPLKTIMVCPWQ